MLTAHLYAQEAALELTRHHASCVDPLCALFKGLVAAQGAGEEEGRRVGSGAARAALLKLVLGAWHAWAMHTYTPTHARNAMRGKRHRTRSPPEAGAGCVTLHALGLWPRGVGA
jgi:hypothetical protein